MRTHGCDDCDSIHWLYWLRNIEKSTIRGLRNAWKIDQSVSDRRFVCECVCVQYICDVIDAADFTGCYFFLLFTFLWCTFVCVFRTKEKKKLFTILVVELSAFFGFITPSSLVSYLPSVRFTNTDTDNHSLTHSDIFNASNFIGTNRTRACQASKQADKWTRQASTYKQATTAAAATIKTRWYSLVSCACYFNFRLWIQVCQFLFPFICTSLWLCAHFTRFYWLIPFSWWFSVFAFHSQTIDSRGFFFWRIISG